MLWLLAIPGLPAAAFAIMLALPRAIRNRILWLPLGAILGSLALSFYSFSLVWPGGTDLTSVKWAISWQLAVIGGLPFRLGLQLDAVAAVLLIVVTFVATCVEVYSLSYMKKDEREGWYFAVLSLFTCAMLTLVLADNLLLLFFNWEVMGLCSYLLIGFWYELEAPRKASQKAFMTTRVGDLGLLFALFVIFNEIHTWQISIVLESVTRWGPGVATAAAIGLLLAAMGKSAQVPLHVWLPDAMAGPTPASALIHAATMVAAGVYLVARTLPIFKAAPAVLFATLVIGAITALVGGLLAGVQHDVKKVLAYSTISQLGLMFMALGAGSVVAAMFHLVAHAFFKSLLFLGAGVIIHAAHTQDMREMGGLRKHMPVTWITFLIGSLALAGVVPFSGFFSKDLIIASLLHEHQYWAVAVVFIASGLTAFYMTRMLLPCVRRTRADRAPPRGLAGHALADGAARRHHALPRLRLDDVHDVPRRAGRVAYVGVDCGLHHGRRYRHRHGLVDVRPPFGRGQHGRVQALLGPSTALCSRSSNFDLAYEVLIIRPYMRVCDWLAIFAAAASTARSTVPPRMGALL